MILLLNGSINAGKTTISKSIVERGINFAHIEVDVLRNFISWIPLEDSIELNIKNAVQIAKNFDDKNIHSIISYPLSNENYKVIKKQLKDTSIKIHAVTLYPGLKTLKSNRGDRALSAWEIKRIDELHEMKLTMPSFGIIIDNSKQTIEETTDSVLSAIGISP